MSKGVTAAVLGATGNVGNEIVLALLKREDIRKIVLINRREIPQFKGEPKIEQHQVAMNAGQFTQVCKPILSERAADEGVDVAYIAMGVGAPSKVSPEQLELVDVTLPTEFASAAKSAGVQHISLLTSVGADITKKRSWLTSTAAGGGLYLHLKGQVEKNVQDLGFESFSVFRPAGLMGNSNTPGFFEWLNPKIDFLLPDKFKSIKISTLGTAMANCGVQAVTGSPKPAPFSIYEGSAIHKFV